MKRILALGVKSLYLLLAIALVLFLVYLFGHSILEGELKGGDSAFAFHNAFWYQRWWPRIPLWYPVQGGGYSFTLSYPILPSLMTVFSEQATSLNLNQAFRLVYFGLYFWAALGVYLFGAWRLKNQTVGLMAAIFYLILPGIWYWAITVGLFAFVVASSFIPWVFIFFDFWLSCFFNRNCSPRKRALALFLTALSLGIAMMSHVLIGAPIIVGLLIYGVVRGLTYGRKLFSIRQAFRGFLATLLCLVVWSTLFGFWLFPYFYYNYFISRGGVAPEPLELIVEGAGGQGIRGILFGQETLDSQDSLPILKLSPMVTISFLIGLISAFFLRGKALAIGIAMIIFMFLTGIAAKLPADWLKRLQLILALNFRSVTVVHALAPLVASCGIWQLARMVIRIPFRRLKLIFTFLLAWLIFISGLVFFERGLAGEAQLGYGPSRAVFSKEIEDQKQFYFRPRQGRIYAFDFLKRIPQTEITISSLGNPATQRAEKVVSLMPLDQFSRVGWTRSEGLGLQAFGNYTEASTLGQYMYRSSLFFGIRGYADEVFFKGIGSPVSLSDLSRWIGYDYVLTKPAKNDTSPYLPPDWLVDKETEDVRIYKFQDPQGMATITQRPLVLVIGKAFGAYEQVFRASVEGVLPYKKAWLVEGKERIDDYTSKELGKFKGLILHGYSYKSATRAFSLLDGYVKDGGWLFIDTGWQFVSKDWELDEAPAVFPVTGTSWSAKIPPGSYPLSSKEEKKLSLTQLPLEWHNQPWGVSVAEGLKDWGKPVLKIQGKTIMVEGEYGKGKVFWSGLNLFAYLNYHDFDRDLIFLGRSVFDYLLGDLPREESLPKLSLSRDYPDRLEISLEGPVSADSKLLWREPYSPQWRVGVQKTEDGKQKTEKLKTYRAGPGFLLMFLPKTSQPTKVILEYKLGWEGVLGKLVSLVTLGGFLLMITTSGRMGKIRLKMSKKIKNTWEKEEV